MIPTNAIFILSGLGCVFLSGFTLYAIVPREGKPSSAWTRTDSRATGMALVLVALFVLGGGLLMKGLLS